MRRQRLNAAHAQSEMSHRPRIGELGHAECHKALPAASGRLRHYRQACAAFDHLADHVKTAQAHPNFQLPTDALGLLAHKILQSASRAETDVVMVEGLGKCELALSSQWMAARHYQNKEVAREREGLELQRGIDRTRDNANIGTVSSDLTHDLGAFHFLQIDIDIRVECQKWGQRCR